MKLKSKLAILTMALAVFTACEKKEDKPAELIVPQLTSPANNTVLEEIYLTEEGLIDDIRFSWEESQNGVQYAMHLSTDNNNFIVVNTVNKLNSIPVQQSDYAFEFGKTYYWKVKAIRLDSDGNTTDETKESEVFSFTTNIVALKKLSFKSSSYTYQPSDYKGNTAFIDITWEDAPNMEYAEITFTPALAGVEQPIKVNAGEEFYRIDGFNGWGSVASSPEPQVYEFTVKTYGIDNLVAEGESFKAQPLTNSFVHDYDFNTYIPIKMGEQVWLSSNLRTTHYNTGEAIEEHIINYGWTDGEHSYDEITYSFAGNWGNDYISQLKKGTCPDGFHISTDDDWTELEGNLGLSDYDIYKLRGEDQLIAKALKASNGWGLKSDGSSANGNDVYHFNLTPNEYGYESDVTMYDYLFECPITKVIAPHKTDTSLGFYNRVIIGDCDGIIKDYGTRGVVRCVQDSE